MEALMPVRKPEIRSSADAIGQLAERIRSLETTASRRVVPPGYEYSVDGTGNLVITRLSDGATAIVSFT